MNGIPLELEEVKKLQEEYKLNYLLAKILVNKGITEKEQIKKFLNYSSAYCPMWQGFAKGTA